MTQIDREKPLINGPYVLVPGENGMFGVIPVIVFDTLDTSGNVRKDYVDPTAPLKSSIYDTDLTIIYPIE